MSTPLSLVKYAHRDSRDTFLHPRSQHQNTSVDFQDTRSQHKKSCVDLQNAQSQHQNSCVDFLDPGRDVMNLGQHILLQGTDTVHSGCFIPTQQNKLWLMQNMHDCDLQTGSPHHWLWEFFHGRRWALLPSSFPNRVRSYPICALFILILSACIKSPTTPTALSYKHYYYGINTAMTDASYVHQPLLNTYGRGSSGSCTSDPMTLRSNFFNPPNFRGGNVRIGRNGCRSEASAIWILDQIVARS